VAEPTGGGWGDPGVPEPPSPPSSLCLSYGFEITKDIKTKRDKKKENAIGQ